MVDDSVAERYEGGAIMVGRGLCCLCILIFAETAAAAPPRAIVAGPTPPTGVTVLDRRGDLWLVTGDAAHLATIPGANMLADKRNNAAATRDFTPNPTPAIAALVAQIDAAALMAEVDWLVGLGVRSNASSNLSAVADSLEAKLASYGLATEQDLFSWGSLSLPNVIATQTGVVHPDSIFVFCAHYDAISENQRFLTPGADDNGSGVATLLTAARLLSDTSLDYTVKFVLFGGEEGGLVGSADWVSEQGTAGALIVGALNVDMIAWRPAVAPGDLEIVTNPASRWLADAVQFAATEYSDVPSQVHVDDSMWYSDHSSFWDNGYDAVLVIEGLAPEDYDYNPYWHTTSDTPDHLVQDFFASNAKTTVGTIALLARAANVSQVPAAGVSAARLTADPNPFNGRLALRLEAAGAEGEQPVGIYDLRGRRVGSLVIHMNAGVGEIVWDARSIDGLGLSGGLYLARADALPGRPSCKVTYVP
jgi:hypothetical protein